MLAAKSPAVQVLTSVREIGIAPRASMSVSEGEPFTLGIQIDRSVKGSKVPGPPGSSICASARPDHMPMSKVSLAANRHTDRALCLDRGEACSLRKEHRPRAPAFIERSRIWVGSEEERRGRSVGTVVA